MYQPNDFLALVSSTGDMGVIYSIKNVLDWNACIPDVEMGAPAPPEAPEAPAKAAKLPLLGKPHGMGCMARCTLV